MMVSEFHKSLLTFEAHFKLRNFLVGHQLTMADALLVTILSACFTSFFDKKTRDNFYPNLTRYATLILQMPAFEAALGKLELVKDAKLPTFA